MQVSVSPMKLIPEKSYFPDAPTYHLEPSRQPVTTIFVLQMLQWLCEAETDAGRQAVASPGSAAVSPSSCHRQGWTAKLRNWAGNEFLQHTSGRKGLMNRTNRLSSLHVNVINSSSFLADLQTCFRRHKKVPPNQALVFQCTQIRTGFKCIRWKLPIDSSGKIHATESFSSSNKASSVDNKNTGVTLAET